MREINWLHVLLFGICCILAFALGYVGWHLLNDNKTVYDNTPEPLYQLEQRGGLGEAERYD